MSRTRKLLFGATSVLYAVIVVAVLIRADLVRLDWQVMLFRPYKQWPQLHEFLDYFVVLGQRGPTAVLVAAWLGWRSWRQRTLRPLLVLGTALLALNATVGAVKIGLGRLGPHYATSVGSAELFAGGDIFPSGHTANAVVTWGILAYLATTPRARRVLSVVAANFALGVGATTVYLGTHWVSDVLLGWAAGLLILLGLPWAEPVIAWAEERIQAWRDRARTTSPGRRLVPSPLSPVTQQSLFTSGRGLPAEEMSTAQDEAQHGETAVIGGRATASTSSGTGIGAARLYHPAGRQHPLRAERAPVSPQPPVGPAGPAGPRRPYSDRSQPRTAHLGPRGK
jgi:membrane-associated phospholipid phosphatase